MDIGARSSSSLIRGESSNMVGNGSLSKFVDWKNRGYSDPDNIEESASRRYYRQDRKNNFLGCCPSQLFLGASGNLYRRAKLGAFKSYGLNTHDDPRPPSRTSRVPNCIRWRPTRAHNARRLRRFVLGLVSPACRIHTVVHENDSPAFSVREPSRIRLPRKSCTPNGLAANKP